MKVETPHQQDFCLNGEQIQTYGTGLKPQAEIKQQTGPDSDETDRNLNQDQTCVEQADTLRRTGLTLTRPTVLNQTVELLDFSRPQIQSIMLDDGRDVKVRPDHSSRPSALLVMKDRQTLVSSSHMN